MKLFGQVAKSMQALELATSEAETVAALGLLGSAASPGLETLLTGAKRAARSNGPSARWPRPRPRRAGRVRRVVSHPAYGFGPGDTALDVEARRALASASGLNGATLALL